MKQKLRQYSGVTTIARLGLLTAAALTLGYLESLLPLPGIPGVKLGLANTVLLYALYGLGVRSAAILMLLKVGLSGLLFGGPSAMLYSFSGGVLSLLAMLLARRIRGIGVVGVSVCGALLHNVGQLLAACLVVGVRPVLAYLPALLVAAAVTGTLTGVAAQYAFRALLPGQARVQQNGGIEKKTRKGV